MLDARDLRDMRAEMVASYADSAQVLRKISAPDGLGGQTTAWAPTQSASGQPLSFPCRCIPQRVQGESVVAGRIEAVTDFRIFLPVGTDVTAKDRLAITSPDPAIGGATLEVQDTESNESECLCLVAHGRRIA